MSTTGPSFTPLSCRSMRSVPPARNMVAVLPARTTVMAPPRSARRRADLPTGPRFARSCQALQQSVGADRQLVRAEARRVEHRVGHGRGDRQGAHLAETDPFARHVVEALRGEVQLDFWRIRDARN